MSPNLNIWKKFDFVAENYDGFIHKLGVTRIPNMVDIVEVEKRKEAAEKAMIKWRKNQNKLVVVLVGSRALFLVYQCSSGRGQPRGSQ